jgi:alanyl-tRNA synthetase
LKGLRPGFAFCRAAGVWTGIRALADKSCGPHSDPDWLWQWPVSGHSPLFQTKGFMSSVNDIRKAFLDYFAEERSRGGGLEPAGAAQRPDADVHQCGHGAVQERLHRARESGPIRGGDGAEMRARRRQAQRPRQCRLHRAPPHLLRDARQLLVRRLFQGARHRACLEPDHQGIRHRRRRLLVTVYHTDDDAFDLWRRSPACRTSRIIRIPTIDNFWAMGDTGPCGPCSEIFYDHGDISRGGPPGSPDEDGDRFIEIWNLVFMQYEQLTPDERVDLPRPSIDTGMGLERIAAVLQGKHDNYDIDLFRR